NKFLWPMARSVKSGQKDRVLRGDIGSVRGKQQNPSSNIKVLAGYVRVTWDSFTLISYILWGGSRISSSFEGRMFILMILSWSLRRKWKLYAKGEWRPSRLNIKQARELVLR